MCIKIRDWDKHFEADRSRQWKSLKWVPIPNKQGLGYKKIMSQKNGPEIFGCWCALVQQASLCDPRGDLSKYSIDDLSINTIIPINILTKAIEFIIQNLDWIEVIENLDINVNGVDKNVNEHAIGSSMLCSSVLCNSSETPQLEKQPTESEIIFDEFWKLYPKKKDKGSALRAWKKIKSPSETFEKIKKALSWQTNSQDWKKDNGQYIPYPGSYLNGIMWEDEKSTNQTTLDLDTGHTPAYLVPFEGYGERPCD